MLQQLGYYQSLSNILDFLVKHFVLSLAALSFIGMPDLSLAEGLEASVSDNASTQVSQTTSAEASALISDDIFIKPEDMVVNELHFVRYMEEVFGGNVKPAPDEFDTIETYLDRIDKLNAKLLSAKGKITADTLLAFRLDGPERLSMVYDAERESYSLSSPQKGGCYFDYKAFRDHKRYEFWKRIPMFYCTFRSDLTESKYIYPPRSVRANEKDRYVVTKIRGTKYLLEIYPEKSPAMLKFLSAGNSSRTPALYLPRDEARAIGSNGIGILLIGRVNDGHVDLLYRDETRHNKIVPIDKLVITKTIGFSGTKVILFAKNTGKVLRTFE